GARRTDRGRAAARPGGAGSTPRARARLARHLRHDGEGGTRRPEQGVSRARARTCAGDGGHGRDARVLRAGSALLSRAGRRRRGAGRGAAPPARRRAAAAAARTRRRGARPRVVSARTRRGTLARRGSNDARVGGAVPLSERRDTALDTAFRVCIWAIPMTLAWTVAGVPLLVGRAPVPGLLPPHRP